MPTYNVETIGLPLGDSAFEDEVTIVDPKAMTKPWTVAKRYVRKPGASRLGRVFSENNCDGTDGRGGATDGR